VLCRVYRLGAISAMNNFWYSQNQSSNYKSVNKSEEIARQLKAPTDYLTEVQDQDVTLLLLQYLPTFLHAPLHYDNGLNF
ncbi:hypothetical protein STEG23_023175, partial [Scotinomys teguina]